MTPERPVQSPVLTIDESEKELFRNISPTYLEKASQEAEDEIRKRSLVRIPMYFLLYLAILGVTPISRKYQVPVHTFGMAILFLTLLRFMIAFSWKQISPSNRKLATVISSLVFYLLAGLWGAFCGSTLVFFELGWVSFFVVLVTCGIVAGEMSALAPKWSLLIKYLLLMLAPSLIICFFVLNGLSGLAMGTFFAGYLVVLSLQGRVQFVEYWLRLRESAQLEAMIDSVPGILTWVSSDLKYLGANQKTAKLWELPQNEFKGKPLGTQESDLALAPFAKTLFESSKDETAAELQLTIQGKVRSCFFFGQKYNHGTEAILLGLDMTEFRETERSVVIERAQRLFTSRLANLGQVSQRLIQSLDQPIAELNLLIGKNDPANLKKAVVQLETLSQILKEVHEISPDDTPLQKLPALNPARLIESTRILFEPYAEPRGIRLFTQGQEGAPLEIRGIFGQLMEVIISLLNNAFDAVSDSAQKEVRLEMQLSTNKKNVEISISDTGKGIPENVKARLFEPLFTTKSAGQATASGLTVSREIVEMHQGRLILDPESKATRFVMTLPLAQK